MHRHPTREPERCAVEHDEIHATRDVDVPPGRCVTRTPEGRHVEVAVRRHVAVRICTASEDEGELRAGITQDSDHRVLTRYGHDANVPQTRAGPATPSLDQAAALQVLDVAL